MAGNQQLPTVISFGPFDADLQTQELRKQGVRLRLPGQSFQILKLMLERPGELVSREELHKALWPSDTFVDFEHGVNAAVNRLREALGDSADCPSIIETLPRRGYRFIGPIREHPSVASITSESKETTQPYPAPVSPTEGTGDRQNWLKIGAWIFFGAVLATTAIFYTEQNSGPHQSS